MGGLVIRTYLERDDARAAYACVFIATPHRGAALTDVRKDLFMFKLFFGRKAALQLSPEAEIYERLGAVPCARVATIVGSSGTAEGWNDDIPGDDDGTVAVAEAQLPDSTAHLELPYGHTRLSCAQRTIHGALRFLRHGLFRAD